MAPPFTREQLRSAVHSMLELAAAYERRGSHVDKDSERLLKAVVGKLLTHRKRATERYIRSRSVRLIEELEDAYRQIRKTKEELTEEQVDEILRRHIVDPTRKMIHDAWLDYGEIGKSGGPHRAAVASVSHITKRGVRTIDYRVAKDGTAFVPSAFGHGFSYWGLIVYLLKLSGWKPKPASDMGELIKRVGMLEDPQKTISELLQNLPRKTRKP